MIQYLCNRDHYGVDMTAYQTIIPPHELLPNLEDPDWAVLDCRFSLQDFDRGQGLYRDAHIPGAIYAHLNRDLSGEIIPGETGRHPLPEIAAFTKTLSGWGIDERVQVVAYDDRGGAIAARLWWMLRWLGHEKAAVLEGGWTAWLRAGFPVQKEIIGREPRSFKPQPHPEMAVDVKFMERASEKGEPALVDARDTERYRGEEEPIDPVAGHIPGAVSAPYIENLAADGTFRPGRELKERYQRLLAGRAGDQAVFYCGSGVTSAHDILAMVHAGMDMPRLYPGSWSEWLTDPSRPVEGA